MKEGTTDLYALLERSELNHFKSVIRQIFSDIGRLSLSLDLCAVDHASILRNTGWQKTILGVDSVPPHEMFRLEVIKNATKCSPSPHLDMGFIAIRISSTESGISNPLVTGGVKPYRGSITKNKISTLSNKIQAKTPSLLQRALLVANLETWAFPPHSPLSRLAQTLVAGITDMPYDLLTPQIEQVTGSYQHRLRNDRLDNGGISPLLSNQGTKLQFNTVPLTCLSKGSKNKNVMFQGPLVLASTILGEAFIHQTLDFPSSKLIHLHVQNPSSMRDLDDDPIIYPEPTSKIVIMRNLDSPYLFFPQQKLTSYITRIIKYPPAKKEFLVNIPVSDRFHSLLAYDSLNLLDPWSWSAGTEIKLITNGITINWALTTDLVKYVLALSQLFIAVFFSPHRDLDPQIHLRNTIQLIQRSPLEPWENLSNLCFAPDYPSVLLRFLKSFNTQTTESLTNRSVAILIRTSVLTVLQYFQLNNGVFDFYWINLVAPPSVPTHLHPYRVLEVLSCVRKSRTIYRRVMDYLGKERMNLLLCETERIHTHNFFVFTISPKLSGISSESLDYLCKLPELQKRPNYDMERVAATEGITKISDPYVEITLSVKHVVSVNQNIRRSSPADIITPMISNRDYEMYKYRPAPLPTSGSYKLLSVLPLLRDIPKRKCLALADGTGGFTRVLSLLPESELVVYNTLVTDKEYVTQMDPIQHIPDISDLPFSIRKKVEGLREVNDFPSDITTSGYPTFIKGRWGDNFDVVTGDAEDVELFSNVQTIRLFGAYRNICATVLARSGVFKIHSHSTYVIQSACVLLLTYFDRVQVARSPYSLRSNNEFYLVCTVGTPPSYLDALTVCVENDQFSLNLHLTHEIACKFNSAIQNKWRP